MLEVLGVIGVSILVTVLVLGLRELLLAPGRRRSRQSQRIDDAINELKVMIVTVGHDRDKFEQSWEKLSSIQWHLRNGS